MDRKFRLSPINIIQDISEFDKLTVCVAIEKLFNDGTFYSSSVKNIAEKLKDVHLDPEFVKSFELLHCVKYADMPAELHKELKLRILEAFRIDPNIVDVDVKQTEPGSSESFSDISIKEVRIPIEQNKKPKRGLLALLGR